MDSPVELLSSALDRTGTIVAGLRLAAAVLAATSAVGALLAVVGLALLGAPWWLTLPLVLIVLIPALMLWRFRRALYPALELPRRLRELPTVAGDLVGDASDLVAQLGGLKDVPRSPLGFARNVRGLRGVVERARASTTGEVAEIMAALSPVRLVSGGTAGLFAAGSLVFGCLLLLAGVVFG